MIQRTIKVWGDYEDLCVSSGCNLQVLEILKNLYPSHEVSLISQIVPDHFANQTITTYDQ